MIKIVVDIENDILAGDSGMHYECEQLLLEQGSVQENLWGANWFPTNKASNSKRLSIYVPMLNECIQFIKWTISRQIDDKRNEFKKSMSC